MRFELKMSFYNKNSKEGLEFSNEKWKKKWKDTLMRTLKHFYFSQ